MLASISPMNSVTIFKYSLYTISIHFIHKPTKFVMAGYETNISGEDAKVTAEIGSTLGHLIGSVGVGVPVDMVTTGKGITDIDNYSFTLKGGFNW